MITGSLAGPLCAGGGFCAGSEEVVEHQRISSASYTFSAALPAMLSTTASETVRMIQDSPQILASLRENIAAMRAQLDPRSQWVNCSSHPENPIMLLVLKPEVVAQRNLSSVDQEWIFQECVDECLNNSVLVTRLKGLPVQLGASAKDENWQPRPALKVCVTTGLTKKETERAGVVIRHAVTKVMKAKAQRLSMSA